MTAVSAALAFKVKIDFTQADIEWTEFYYWASGNSSLTNFEEDCTRLVSCRQQLLQKQVEVDSLSYAQLNIANGTDVKSSTMGDLAKGYLTTDIGYGPGSVQAHAAMRDITALTQLTAELGLYRRALMLRGMDWTLWGYDPTQQAAPPIPVDLGTQAAAFLGQLTGVGAVGVIAPNGQWCIKASERDPVANPKIVITGIDAPNGQGDNWQITLKIAQATWVQGTKIHVHGITGDGVKGLNGDHYIQSVAGSTYTLYTTKKDGCPIDWDGNGVAYLRLYRLFAIDSAVIERFVVRKTGGVRAAGRGAARKPFTG